MARGRENAEPEQRRRLLFPRRVVTGEHGGYCSVCLMSGPVCGIPAGDRARQTGEPVLTVVSQQN